MSEVFYRVTSPDGHTVAGGDTLEEAEARVPEVTQWHAETDEGPWKGYDQGSLHLQGPYQIDKFIL